MRINKLGSLIGLSAVLALGPLAAAQAQKTGLYVGAAAGAYSIDESNLSDNDHVLKAYVGGQFTDWFGIEGSWSDFNRLDNDNDHFESDGAGLAGGPRPGRRLDPGRAGGRRPPPERGAADGPGCGRPGDRHGSDDGARVCPDPGRTDRHEACRGPER